MDVIVVSSDDIRKFEMDCLINKDLYLNEREEIHRKAGHNYMLKFKSTVEQSLREAAKKTRCIVIIDKNFHMKDLMKIKKEVIEILNEIKRKCQN